MKRTPRFLAGLALVVAWLAPSLSGQVGRESVEFVGELVEYDLESMGAR